MIVSKLKNNTVSGIISYSVIGFSSFAAIPIIYNILGQRGFSIFALISLWQSFGSIFLFGLNTFIITVVTGKYSRLQKVELVNGIVYIQLLFQIIISILGISNSSFILHSVLNLPDVEASIYGSYLIAVIISSILYNNSIIISSIYEGIGKLYYQNYFTSIYSLLINITVVIILLNKVDFHVLAIYHIGVSFVLSIVFIIILKYRKQNIFTFPSRKSLQIGFSSLPSLLSLQATTVMTFLYEPVSKIVISRIIGLEMYSIIDIMFRMRNMFSGIMVKLIYPLVNVYQRSRKKTNSNRIFKFIIYHISYYVPYVLLISFILVELYLNYFVKNVPIEYRLFVSIAVGMAIFNSFTVPIYFYFQFTPGKEYFTTFIQLTNILIFIGLLLLFYSSLSVFKIVIFQTMAIMFAFGFQVLLLSMYRNSLAKVYLNMKIYLASIITISMLLTSYLLIKMVTIEFFGVLIVIIFIIYLVTMLLFQHGKSIKIFKSGLQLK